MTTDLLDESYLTWLYGQHSKVRRTKSANTYWRLTKQLYCKEFVWFVANDDNRAEDGRTLRLEFLEESGVWYDVVDENWMNLGCSMLELLIALSRRLSFETDDAPKEWFWHLLNNLGLSELNDKHLYQELFINESLERVIWRTYAFNGNGGLFPLRSRGVRDQRRVELWDQMSAYLIEHR